MWSISSEDASNKTSTVLYKAERRVCVSQDLARTDLAAFFSIARPIDNKFAADGA